MDTLFTLIKQAFNILFSVISTIYHTIADVINWIMWFLPALFTGEVFELFGRVIRNVGAKFFSSMFDLLPVPDVSVFTPYSGFLNWLIPVDYAIGSVSIIVAAITLKMVIGWALRWLW